MIGRSSYCALIGALVLAGAAAACTTPVNDIAGLGPSPAQHHSTKGDDDDDDSTTSADTTTSSSSSSSSSSGGSPIKPAATTAPPAPPVDPFAGADAFTQITPAVDSSQQHLGTSNAGKDCLSCHGVPDDGAPTFSMAGTLHETRGADDGATGAQVRIVGPDGSEIALVGTDSAGNFWSLGQTQIPAGSHVGVRDGSVEQKMTGTIANGSCNTAGCHDPTRPLFLNPGGG